MRGIGGSTLRGGQTVFHGIRMWGQLFRAAVFFAAFTTVAVPAWTLWHRTTGAEWYAAGMATLAEVKLALGYDPDSGQEIRFADGTRRVLRIRDIAASVPALEARERIKAEMFASAGLGAASGAGLIALFLVVFWYRGAQLGRQKRIRGAEMVTAGELRSRLQSPHERLLQRLPGGKRLRPYSIAGIPYPERTETQHTIVRTFGSNGLKQGLFFSPHLLHPDGSGTLPFPGCNRNRESRHGRNHPNRRPRAGTQAPQDRPRCPRRQAQGLRHPRAALRSQALLHPLPA